MRRIASRPSAGRLPCAARPCTTTSAHENPLWATPSIEIRRLGDDGLVRAPLTRDGLGADARVLFVGDGGHDDATAAAAA